MNQKSIEQAMDTKSVIQFTYKDHLRIVEPHVLGVSKGRLQILGYQVGGTSSSGGIPQWRRFTLDEIEKLTIVDEKFPGQRDVLGEHSSWDEVLLIVEP